MYKQKRLGIAYILALVSTLVLLIKGESIVDIYDLLYVYTTDPETKETT